MRLSRWLNLVADHSGDALLAVYAVAVAAGVLLVVAIALGLA